MYKKWSLEDLKTVSSNGFKVFSFFSCGGGSTMGYKLAGFDVIGNCEIDKQICSIYQKNHHPLYSLMKIILPANHFRMIMISVEQKCNISVECLFHRI